MVYSITMRDTFRSVSRFYDHIIQVKGKEEGEVRNRILPLFVCLVLCIRAFLINFYCAGPHHFGREQM